MSSFCSLVSFLILFPFARLGEPGRNDADNLISMSFTPGVNDEEQLPSFDHPDGVPAFFVRKEVSICQREGIFENQSCSLKANPVLPEIFSIFLIVPFKAHRRTPDPLVW